MKRLLLLGGGHAHVHVMRALARTPPPATQVTLVSRGRFTPYSGMLPGLLSGLNTFEESHIDLKWLASDTGCAFVAAEATRIDVRARRVECADGTSFDYDVLSIDTGSTPAIDHVPGAREHALPVKPVDRFLAEWDAIESQIAAGKRPCIAVVGGGAGGVELLLSLQHRLRTTIGDTTRFLLVTDEADVLMSHNASVRRIFRDILKARGVEVHLGHAVVRVDPGVLHRTGGETIRTDFAVWVTTASAPTWIAEAGLATDNRGFIAVNDRLQSTSHPEVFAAGDVATMLGHPRPKSGVFAVRQGPPLARNLRCALSGEALTPHTPQRLALALIGTGDRYAVASWGPFAAKGHWVWRWKRYLDRRWMRTYLPPDRLA
ncbi:MAG: FAD-dependent oxidoreductase [Burkholderiales bacterium]